MLNYQGWSGLLEYEAPIFRELVLIFYFNWNPSRYASMTKGVDLDFRTVMLSPEEHLGEILGVPVDEEDDELKKEEIFNNLSLEHVYTAADTYMRTRDMSIEVRMLRKVLGCMFVPKLGATEQVTAGKANVLWRVYTYQRVSLPKLMFAAFNHLLQRTDHIVPYGVWLTKIFEYFHVPLDGEAYLQVSSQRKDWVGATLLKRMGVRMSQYIAEMDAYHQMEAGEDEEGEEEEGEEGVPPREEVGVEEGADAPLAAGGSADHAPSPTRAAPATAGLRSSAYTFLADEVSGMKAEIVILRTEVHEVKT